jgi:hypothetical protein
LRRRRTRHFPHFREGRLDQKHYIGLVVRAAAPQRVEEVLDDCVRRIARDYQAVLPPTDRPTA